MAAILDAILDFGESSRGDSWGLLVCYFTHIPGHVLKNSACYEIFPGYNQCSWTIGHNLETVQDRR